MFSGKNKYDRGGLQVAPRFSWTASENAGKSMAAPARLGTRRTKLSYFLFLCFTLLFLLFTVPNVERVFMRINIQLWRKLVTARSLRPETPGKEPLVKKPSPLSHDTLTIFESPLINSFYHSPPPPPNFARELKIRRRRRLRKRLLNSECWLL